jgi:hypothetical protein
MTIRKTKFVFWFMALATLVACGPRGAAPIIPTMDPNAIGTLIVQTANVALTRTAAAVPTSTPTITLTPTPRFTNTPEPTATATIIFIFSSPTSRVPAIQATSTLAETSNQAFSCQVMSVTPANGTSFASRKDFDATWRVRNNGQRNWNKDNVDLLYLDGTRMHKVELYDLQETIRRGEIVDLTVDMVAPKNSNTYMTRWTLRAGNETFCTLSLTIVVK